MRLLSASLGLFTSLLILLPMLNACGSSSNETAEENSDPSIQKIGDVSTLATPSKPEIVFNEAGDGISVWSVTSAGTWLYYSLYDRTSDSWSQPQQLAAVASESWTLEPQVVSSNAGFAIAWLNADSELFIKLFNNGELQTSQMSAHAEGRVEQYQLKSNGQGYLLVWKHRAGYEINSSISLDGKSWESNSTLFQNGETAYMELGPVSASNTSYMVTFYDQNQYQLYGRIFNGSDWQNAEQLISISIERSQVLLASNGEGFSLVWTDISEQFPAVWNRVYTNSEGWSESNIITTYDSLDVSTVDISHLVSNGTGYCLSVEINDSAIEAIVDPQGIGSWGDSTQLIVPGEGDNSLHQHTMTTDGESYGLVVNYIGIDASEQATLRYYARLYQNGSWNLNDRSSISMTAYDLYVDPNLHHAKPINFAGVNGIYATDLVQHESGSDNVISHQYSYTDGWLDMVLLEADQGVASNPLIVVNPLKGLTAVWNQVDDNGDGLSTYSSQLQDSQWSEKQLMFEANYLFGSSYEPRLVAGSNGGTLAVWLQDRNGYRALMANINTDGQWHDPIVLANAISKTPPRVAANNSGYAVVWEEETYDKRFHLKTIVFNADQWSESLKDSAILLHTYSGQLYTALASKGDDYHITYLDVVGERQSKNLVSRYYDGATWLEAVTIAEGVYSDRYHPQIATNGTTYRTVWMQGDLEDMNLYSSEFDGETWSQPQFVSHLEEKVPGEFVYEFYYLNAPVITSNGDGYGVFWFDGTKVNGSLFTDRWSDPELLGEVQALSEHEGPMVSSNGSGYAVVWFTLTESEIGYGSALYANVYDGASWHGAVKLSSDDSHEVFIFDPSEASKMLTVSGDRYGIIWGTPYTSPDDSAFSVYASVFDGSGWSANVMLNRNEAEIKDFQLAGNREGFLSAWLQLSSHGQFKLLTKQFDQNGWAEREIVAESEYDKYDLSLIDSEVGYQAIWTGVEEGGDDWVRVPWSSSGL
jgi:hypothetical protein